MIGIEFGADLTPISDYAGALKALVEDWDRDMMDSISDAAAEVAVQAFNEGMDAMSDNAPERFGHMYDWGKLGQESGRLWRVMLAGNGGMKLATFNYKRSTEEVPAGEAETGIAGDTRKGGHVFKWKAEIIEEGLKVGIQPTQAGGWLAIPAEEFINSMGRKNQNKGGTMWFTQSRVSPPVNQIARGAFTEAWVTHFTTTAIAVVEKSIVKQAEQYLESYVDVVLAGRRIRPVQRKVIIVASKHGESLGHKANGRFKKLIDAEAQILKFQRLADSYE